MRRAVMVLVAAAMFCVALSAYAQTYNIKYTGGWTTTADGFGAGLYNGTLNGVATHFVCDDTFDDIGTNQSWTATGLQASSLNSTNIGNTMFGGGTRNIGLDGYAELATAISAMYNLGNGGASGTVLGVTGVTQSDLSAVVWYITGGKAFGGSNTTTEQALYNALVGKLGSLSDTAAEAYLSKYKDLWIFTPTGGQGKPGATGDQEFWYKAPEGGSTLAYLLLAMCACFGALVFSRKQQQVA